MAFDKSFLAQAYSVNGFSRYVYHTTDPITTVDTGGYFNNTDDDTLLRAGDLIDVITWNTAERTGTIADVSLVIVTTVDSAGVANVSTDIYEKGIYSSAD